jgi:hypothetical protein
MSEPKNSNAVQAPHNDQKLLASYQVLANRRLAQDSLMWQTPALGLTAQAFLFNIALNSTSSRTARLISMFLALITSLLSMQLMSKHRNYETNDSKNLENFEAEHSFPMLHHSSALKSPSLFNQQRIFFSMSSYRVWMAGLAMFAITAIFIIVITIAVPEILQ